MSGTDTRIKKIPYGVLDYKKAAKKINNRRPQNANRRI